LLAAEVPARVGEVAVLRETTRQRIRVFLRSCGWILGFFDLREHAGKDLKAQVLLIAQAIGTALNWKEAL
jgi:hypothetical protein